MNQRVVKPRDPQAPPSAAFVTAVYAVILYMGYALFLRLSCYRILVDNGAAFKSFAGPPLSLPFILGEELIIGLIAAMLLYGAWRHLLWRSMAVALWAGYLIFLATEQMVFKYFFSHIDYTMYAESHDIGGLSSSITAAMDRPFFLHLALVAVCLAALLVPYRPGPVRALARRVTGRKIATAGVVAAYLAVSVTLATSVDQLGLDHSSPVAFALSYLRARAEERRLLAVARRAPTVIKPAPPPLAAPTVVPRGGDEMAAVREAIAAYPGRLNVVFYLMESTSFHETSLDPAVRFDTTPFIKKLAAESLLFTRYYAGVASSARIFFSAMTGLYPFVDPKSDMTPYSQLKVPSLVDILHEVGYATAFFTSSNARFDSLDAFLMNRPYDIIVDESAVPISQRGTASAEYWGMDEEITIDKALAWIETTAAAGRPFFINYNAIFPHHPYDVPGSHAALQKMGWGPPGLHAHYRASLRYADLSFERFYKGLARLGLIDNTLLVVAPDHGEAFGNRHPMNQIHARFCYDDDMHILLLLHQPKALGKAGISARLGAHVDLLPTLLEVLRISPPPAIDGQSLIGERYRDPMVFCYSRSHLAVRDERFKLISKREWRKLELYDMTADPNEKSDLSQTMPDEAATYKMILDEWQASVIRAYRKRVEETGRTPAEIARRARENREARQQAIREAPR